MRISSRWAEITKEEGTAAQSRKTCGSVSCRSLLTVFLAFFEIAVLLEWAWTSVKAHLSRLLVNTHWLGRRCASQGNDRRGDTHCRAIAIYSLAIDSDQMRLRNGIHNLCGRRGDHVAQLVSNSGERRSEGWWGELVEVDWNDTPSTLDEELNHETAG